jgi:hypothetical protein
MPDDWAVASEKPAPKAPPPGAWEVASEKPAPPQDTIPKNYGFTAHHMAAQGIEGIKQLGSSLYGMGKDILFPEGETEADKLKFLAHKYITDPADREQILARNAKTPWESLGHSIAQSLPLVGPWAASLGEQAGTGDVGGALAKGGTQVAAVKAAPTLLKGTKVAAGMAREAIGEKIHTPEGDLTPGAELAGKVGGGAAGAAVGSAVGHEYIGAAAGYKMGPELLDKVFPEPKNAAEARAQAEAYQAKAEDLMRRGKEQEALDKKATASQRLKDKLAAQAAKNAPKPSPFPNATSTSPEEAMFQKNFGPEYKQAGDLAEWETGSREGNQAAQTAAGWKTQQPFPVVQKLSDLKAGNVSDDLISRTKTIVKPGEPPSAADLKRAGDLTQVPLTKLKQLASWGDELAKNEIIRRLRNQ